MNQNKTGAGKIFLGFVILALGIYTDMIDLNQYIGVVAIFLGPLLIVYGFKKHYRKIPANESARNSNGFFWNFLAALSIIILLVNQYIQSHIGTCRWGTPQVNPWCDLGLWLIIIPAIGMLIYLVVLVRTIISKNV